MIRERIYFPPFAKFSVFSLCLTLLVILWGAFVRASGSGAGCGAEWPLCKGKIFPESPSLETTVEFTHRATSGLAFLVVVVLLLWARKLYERNHPVRLASLATMVFITLEALIGALLVLKELVVHDASTARVVVFALHLLNTFLLTGAHSLVVLFSLSGSETTLPMERAHLRWSLVALLLLSLVGVTGALASLGGTLFPAQSISHGISMDFSAESHYLLRLRIGHPILAILTVCYLMVFASVLIFAKADPLIKVIARFLVGTCVLQLILGMANLLLLAPVWLQLLHLLIAHALWINVLLIAARGYIVGKPLINQQFLGLQVRA